MMRALRPSALPSLAFRICLAVAAVGCARASAPPAASRDPEQLALAHATVVDVERGVTLSDRTILVSGGRIAAVVDGRDARLPAGTRVVDATGKFVIPGLWDMHVHTVDRAIDFPLHLAFGVTGIRDMGGAAQYPPSGAWGIHFDSLRRWRGEIAAGRMLGPRVVAGGIALDGPDPVHTVTRSVRSPEDGRQVVDSLRREGVDFIKVYTRLPRDIFLAVANEARRRGLTVAGHLSNQVDPDEAAAAGLRSFEHILFERYVYDTTRRGPEVRYPLASFDTTRLAPIGEALARRGVWFDPTVVWFRTTFATGHGWQDTSAAARARLEYVPRYLRTRWEREVAPARAAPAERAELTRRNREMRYQHFVAAARIVRRGGVHMLAGSDPWNTYIVPGFALHDELELLVTTLGMSPAEALRAATLEPARFFAATDSMGAVAPRRVADLVVLDADPLADIRNARRIHAVVANGRLLDRAMLDGLLRSARDAALRAPDLPP